jgi:putative ABC transport system permease protein
MFWRFVLAAVRFRKRRLLLAFAGLTVAATLATALFSVYADIDRKMRFEFRGYGANLVIAPRGSVTSVPLRAVAEAERLGAAAAPFVYAVGKLRGESVVLAGVDFRRAAPLTTYWSADGVRFARRGECLAGRNVADHFHLAIGRQADLASGPCLVRGIISSGGSEDNQLLLPFDRVAEEAGVSGAASVIQVRAEGSQVEAVRAALAALLPETDVRVLFAVVQTEANVVLKVRTALYLLAGLILAIAVLSVSGTFSTLVMERSHEIGMLKALGAAESRIAALFLAESLVLAVAAAVTGYAAGLGISFWIGRQVFSGPPAPIALGVGLRVFMQAVALTLAVAWLATMMSASRVWRIQPAVILRDE